MPDEPNTAAEATTTTTAPATTTPTTPAVAAKPAPQPKSTKSPFEQAKERIAKAREVGTKADANAIGEDLVNELTSTDETETAQPAEEGPKLTEAEPEGAVTPADKKPETEDAAELSEEGLRGEQPTDTRNMRKRVKHYEGLLSTVEKRAAEEAEKAKALESELGTLKKKLSDLPENAKEQLEEGLRYKRMFALQDDPKVKEFDATVADAEKSIAEMLSSHPDWTVIKPAVDKAGSWSDFGRSAIAYNWTDPDGTVKKMTASEIAKKLLAEIPTTDASAISGLLAEQLKTRRARERFVADESAKAKEWAQQQSKAKADSTTHIKGMQEEISKATKDIHTRAVQAYDWLKDKPMPDTPDEATRKPVIEENAKRKADRELLAAVLDSTPVQTALAVSKDDKAALESTLRIVIDSVRARALERDLRANAKNSLLEKELDDAKTNGRTTRKAGASIIQSQAQGGQYPAREGGERAQNYAVRMRRAGFSQEQIDDAVAEKFGGLS